MTLGLVKVRCWTAVEEVCRDTQTQKREDAGRESIGGVVKINRVKERPHQDKGGKGVIRGKWYPHRHRQ